MDHKIYSYPSIDKNRGIRWTTRKVFDVFQNLTTPDCTTDEPPVSWWAQQLGHDYGRAARFANRVCQPNIYNAYH